MIEIIDLTALFVWYYGKLWKRGDLERLENILFSFYLRVLVVFGKVRGRWFIIYRIYII